jgi:hypothetical protein
MCQALRTIHLKCSRMRLDSSEEMINFIAIYDLAHKIPLTDPVGIYCYIIGSMEREMDKNKESKDFFNQNIALLFSYEIDCPEHPSPEHETLYFIKIPRLSTVQEGVDKFFNHRWRVTCPECERGCSQTTKIIKLPQFLAVTFERLGNAQVQVNRVL